MCRVASKHALSVESEALSQVLFGTAMGEEIDRKVQEAVDRALQGLDERVSSAVTKALEKMVPKDKGRNDEQPPQSSYGGKQPSPSWGDERWLLYIEFLSETGVSPTCGAHKGCHKFISKRPASLMPYQLKRKLAG